MSTRITPSPLAPLAMSLLICNLSVSVRQSLCWTHWMHPVNASRLLHFPIIQTHGRLCDIYILWSKPTQPVARQQYAVRDNVQQTGIHAPGGFEGTVSVCERPQTYALDRVGFEPLGGPSYSNWCEFVSWNLYSLVFILFGYYLVLLCYEIFAWFPGYTTSVRDTTNCRTRRTRRWNTSQLHICIECRGYSLRLPFLTTVNSSAELCVKLAGHSPSDVTKRGYN
jgi:hypothetical protein